MDRRRFALVGASLTAAVLAGTRPAAAAKPPAEWDGLVRVKSKRLDYVYLLPGADFRDYKRVMLDPTEVAFEKNWMRNYNNTTMGLDGRVSASDVHRVTTTAGERATEILAEAFTEGGYPVVTEAAPDVLRLRTGIVNIRVNAPDTRTSARSRSFSEEAGAATLIVEARDSISGALLGRAVDGRVVGDNSMLMRNSMTNRADFRQVAKRWAEISVKGLNELKALSPIAA